MRSPTSSTSLPAPSTSVRAGEPNARPEPARVAEGRALESCLRIMATVGLGDRFGDLFDEVQRSNMSKACKTREEAERTVAHYAAKDQLAHIEEVDGKFLVYRDADNKVLKSVEYSPADLRGIIGEENIPAKK